MITISNLYVTEQGAKITVGDGAFIVECKDGSRRMVPQETLESIMIMGNTSMTNSCMKECLTRGIKVTFLSKHGHYFGRLESTSHTNIARLKRQIYLSDNMEQCILFAKKIQKAKVHNQLVVLRRYQRNTFVDISNELKQVILCEGKIDYSDSIESVMGYEGIAAKNYFCALSKLIKPEFRFEGRNRRPPKDPFNSMLSLGYTIAFYEIFAELESRGINPYIGFIHKVKEQHPALASDLLEEWRAVLVDATVLSLIQGNEISMNQFERDEETGGILISDSGVKLLVRKLEQKMMSNMNYLSYTDSTVSFRRAIWWQVKKLAQCIDEEKLEAYEPLRIRYREHQING